MSFARFSGMNTLSFLLSQAELSALFDELQPYFVRVDKVLEEPIVSKEEVLAAYERQDKRFFPLAMTATMDAIIRLPVKVAKANEPVVMLRLKPDRSFEAFYPTIFQEGESGIIHKVFPVGKFANTALFQKLQRWLRANTIPQKDSPIRLSKSDNIC